MNVTDLADIRAQLNVSLPAGLLARLRRAIPTRQRSQALETAIELIVEGHEERAGRAGANRSDAR